MGDDERMAEILADWYDLRDRGVAQEPEQVVRAHPEHADALLAHFAAQAVFDRIVDPLPGLEVPAESTVGEFRVLREIGRGGMGVVYEAEQTPMARRVALKVLYPTVTSSPRAVARFQREARAAGRLHHTNIVPVYSMGEDRGVWFYAMELVPGRPLDQVVEDLRRLRGTPRERTTATPTTSGFGTDSGSREYYERIARTFAGVAEGLESAHQAGVVHRDIKPSNLILDADGTLRITDFGLARVEGEGATMTLTGDVVGTPAYMSPEQAGGSEGGVDARTDVYSLGATLYEVLTLRPPFRGGSPQEICAKIAREDPVSPLRYDTRIPRDLETVVQKAMERERDRRYRSAGDMARDLRLFAEGAAIHARHIGPLGRAWRRARRHKAMSSMAAGVAALAIVTSVLAVDAARESAARRELRYAQLCVAAQESLARGIGSETTGCIEVTAPDLRQAHAFFARAIDLEPARPDAYFARSLCAGSPIKERLDDLDAARARGLGERAYRLGRSFVFHVFRKSGPRDAEEGAALAVTGLESASDAYLRGQLLLIRGQRRAAIEALGASLRGPRAGGFRFQAHFLRAQAREGDGELGGAIEDLEAVREAGDSEPTVRVKIASLWRRSGIRDRAESVFAETLSDVRHRNTVEGWQEMAAACRICRESAWAVQVTEEACAAHGDSPALLRERERALAAANRHEEALAVVKMARSLAPGDLGLLEDFGDLLLDDGKPEDALRAFGEALRLDPRSYNALWGRGRALEALGKGDDALAAYRTAVDANPELAMSHNHLGCYLFDHRNDATAAEAAFREAIRIEPDFDKAYYNLGTALSSKGELDGASDAYREAIRLNGTFPEVHNNLGMMLISKSEVEGAIAEFHKAILLRPEYALAHYNLGVAFQEKVDIDAAMGSYRDAIRFGFGRADAHVNLGFLLEREGNLDDALAAYQEAVRIDPRHAKAQNNLGSLLRAKKDLGGASTAFRAAIRLNGTYAEPHNNLGIVLTSEGDIGGAIVEFHEAILLRPEYANAHYNLGVALQKKGNNDLAMIAYRDAIRYGFQGPSAHVNLGFLLERKGELDEALAALQEAVQIDPRHAKAQNNLGSLLRAKKDLVRAEAAFRRSVELDQRFTYAWYNLGLTLRDKGDLPGAIEAFRKAANLDPHDADPWNEIGCLLANAGDRAGAMEALRTGIHENPNLPNLHFNLANALKMGGDHAGAVGEYDRALALDEKNALAWNYRGFALWNLVKFDDALASYDRAIAIDGRIASFHYDRGALLVTYLHRWREALPSLESAVALDANLAAGHREYGLGLWYAGRMDEALVETQRAIDLDARDSRSRMYRWRILTALGRHAKALSAAEADLAELPPERPYFAWYKTLSLRFLGRADEARAFATQSLAREPEPGNVLDYAYLCVLAGRPDDARRWLAKGEGLGDSGSAFDRARVCADLGDKESALHWLEIAAGKGVGRPSLYPPEPAFDAVKDDPRFQAAMAKIVVP